MKLTVKDMDIATGDVKVVLLNEKDARLLDLHPMDHVALNRNGRKTIAIVDVGESRKAVLPGHIGLFEEVLDELSTKHGEVVNVEVASKPESIGAIKRKLDGKHLTPKEIESIIRDIVDNKLTDIELTSFVIATYTRGMNTKEIVSLTRSLAQTGDVLRIKKYPVVDLHSIGGVPGNRSTMVIVPILVAAGCIVPKTSSRAITSPSGTADTMEVLAPVQIPLRKLNKIIDDVGGFIIWGGAVNLAPADDKIINIEHPLSIDAEGQMLASIMAKKASVGATHLLMEIPIGRGAKVPDKRGAKHLAKHFAELGNILHIKVKTVIADGSQPVGRGIGPVLEARDVLWTLKEDKRAPQDLVSKSVEQAGILLEFTGKSKPGKGKALAQQLLSTGAAWGAMCKIIEAQGGKPPNPEKLLPARETFTLKAKKNGKIKTIETALIAKVGRLAGAPLDPDAGVYLHKTCGEPVHKGERILTVYARNKNKLAFAIKALLKERVEII